MLIASALRRTATLYWWVTLADDSPQLIVQELEDCLSGSDRDKSDAARMVVELAAIYADDTQFADLLQRLSASTYKHFRDAADACQGRSSILQQLRKRIEGRGGWVDNVQRLVTAATAGDVSLSWAGDVVEPQVPGTCP